MSCQIFFSFFYHFHCLQLPLQIFFSIVLLTLSKIVIFLSKVSSSFIPKQICLVLSPCLSNQISRRNKHMDLIVLLPLWPRKYLKSSLPKGSLIDTTILMISIYFIKIRGFFDEICVLWLKCNQISNIFYPFLFIVLLFL